MTVSILVRGLVGLLALGSSAAIAGDEYRRDSGERYATQPEPLPWRGSTKDDGYPVPQGPSESYSAPPHAPRRTASCVSTVGMRDALNGQGWHAFSDVDYRGPIAYMSARSDRGRRFELQVDSCSGEVIEAKPVVYAAPPRVYYDERPAVGVYIGGGRGYYGGEHRYYRGQGRW
jgi:hypothetical protein